VREFLGCRAMPDDAGPAQRASSVAGPHARFYTESSPMESNAIAGGDVPEGDEGDEGAGGHGVCPRNRCSAAGPGAKAGILARGA